MHLCIMLFLFSLCFIHGATGFSLFDEQHSYVQFERWRDKTDGKIGVSFRCRTYVETGLLLYVDDQTQNSGEYLTLYLRNGFLVLRLRDENRKVFTNRSKVSINDLQWHKIEFELSLHHAAFILDNSTQAEFNISKMQLKSDVYIGGFPNDIDILLLSYYEMLFEKRFLGCVEDVLFSTSNGGNFTHRSANVLRSSGMDMKCKDACKPSNPCQNHGVCINKFAMAECSCTGTGYLGKTCEKESPVVGIASADYRVIFDVPSSYIVASPETTSIFVRFRSTYPDGVFFYTAHKGDYILLELTSGRVAASVNLGSGSITIKTKKNGYNDNQWHRLQLERVKRLVNLTVDNLDVSKGKTRGVFDKFHLPNKKTSFDLGGLADDKRTHSRSVSKKNFTGCLQELIFNGYDVFWKFNTSTKGIVSRGKMLKTCPKTPTKAPKVTETAKTDVLSTINTSTTALGTSKTTKASNVPTTDQKLPNTSTTALDTSNTTKAPDVPTTNQKLPCILAGIPCEGTTTGVPTSQAHVMTSRQQNSTDTLSPTIAKRFPTNDQSTSSSKTLNQSTIDADSSKTTPTSFKASSGASKTSQNPSTDKTTKDTTSEPFPIDKKVTQSNGLPRTTGEVIMASQNERSEGDLTVWFILAAVVGLVAFILAIVIIVKVSTTNRRKYAVKGKKYEKDYWEDTGSFQRSSKPLV